MDLMYLQEVIQSAKKSAKTEEDRQLVENFETFIQIYRLGDRSQPNYQSDLAEANRKFLVSFEKVAANYGIDSEFLMQSFSNPNHFSPERWQELEALKKELAPSPRFKRTKSLKKHKNLKV